MNLAKILAILIGAMILVPGVSSSAESWRDVMDRAETLSKAQNQDSAIVISKLALEKTRAEFGGNDTASARVLHLLGIFHCFNSDFGQADTLFRQALVIREKVLGPDHPDVATSLHNIAENYRYQARYADAVPLHKRALAIYEKALGPDHATVGRSFHSLAMVYRGQARYADAEPLLKKALAIWEKAFGPDDPNVARSLNNFAGLYLDQGKYAEAEPLYQRSLAICERAFGPDHYYVTESLNNLATLYWYQEKYAEAEPLNKRTLAILERDLGPDHPDVALSLNNLAEVYRCQARYGDAEQLYKRALAIYEKALDPDHPEVARSLNNLAEVYRYQARYADAEPLNKRALAIREKALGLDHPDVASSLGILAVTYIDQERFSEAEPLLKRALAIFEKALGPDHPEVAGIRETYSVYNRGTRNLDQGLAEAEKAFNIRLKNFKDNAYVLSERDALTYSQAVRRASGNYFSCLFEIGNAELWRISEGITAALESKGVVSEGIMERQQALATESDSATQKLLVSLRTARLQLSNMFSTGPGDDTTGAYKKQLDSLEHVANDFEAELSRHSVSFQHRQELKDITIDRLKSDLPAQASFVEYLKWDYHQLKPDSLIPRYLALIISKNEEPQIVNLGDASEIEPLIGSYLRHLQRLAAANRQPNAADLAEYKPISLGIYEKIWLPLEKHFKENQTVFVGLDGALNLVSLAGLMDGEPKYLTEKYTLHHLSSGRDLIRLKEKASSGNGLFALGDPDFDASIESRLRQPTEPLLLASAMSDAEYQTRNVRSGCGSLSDLKVESLPFTRKEVENVRQLWHGKGIDSAEVLVGSQATEDFFKTKAPGKRVLHLATHGYYLTGQCAPQIAATHSLGPDQGIVGENPLLQSGLLLAGSNLHGAGCDSAHCEDGILSASEVSGLNLTGTDLVVLSACETGLGEVKAGEGVYGLRRAFQMAGARTVISSLWPVPDEATANVMSQLYGDSMKPLPERLRNLQLAQIKKLRSAGMPDHPYSWAAFIALGDWR